ncbi:MAG: ribonuclease Y [bacterium]|nr:ribonuclease Y [bacterium]
MEILLIAIALAGGSAVGYGTKSYLFKKKKDSAQARADKLLEDTKAKAKEQLLAAKEEAIEMIDETKTEEKKRREQLSGQEKRLAEREINLDAKFNRLDERTEAQKSNEKEIDEIKEELKEIRTRQQKNLEKIAKLNKKEAADKLMQMTEKDIKADLVKLVEKLQRDAKENADDIARGIVSDAMQRIASEQTSERTVTTVAIPNDELKGRIIGKEGRNIQTIERLTGVDVIIDETPGVIVLSGFDPVRRQVARVALENLIKDGRIHPTKIEETVQKAQKEIDQIIKKAGEEACHETGVAGLPPEIVNYLGQLKFRTSYGQNVLKHSIEMTHLAVIIASEIGANVAVCRTAALLHDLGKAVTHEMDGNHHHLTRTLLEKAGVDEAIIHAAEAHHDDIEATTVEALVVRAVDAVSASRPGARGDNVENYAKRMTDLENLTNSFTGVEKSYAISAGREIRVFVKPESIDDLTAIKLARDISNKIEATLKYPGTIKVNVIRETRAIEYAK